MHFDIRHWYNSRNSLKPTHCSERYFMSSTGARRRLTRKLEDDTLPGVHTQRWMVLPWNSSVKLCSWEEHREIGTIGLGYVQTFDADDNGKLSPEEIYGAVRWLKVPNMDAEDVVDFIRAFCNRDNSLGYKHLLICLWSDERSRCRGGRQSVEENESSTQRTRGWEDCTVREGRNPQYLSHVHVRPNVMSTVEREPDDWLPLDSG